MTGAIASSRRGRVAVLTVDRPPHNILDHQTIVELRRAVEELATLPPEELQVAVLRGAGDRAFSTGVAVEDHTRERIARALPEFHDCLRAVMALPAVTVAAVSGHCLGGGLELAAACDLVVATEDSIFGQPEVNVGCFPPFAAALFPARLGYGRAMDLLATGRRLSCREARDLGLVQRMAPAGGLEAALDELNGELLAKSSAVLRHLKQAVRASTPGLEQSLRKTERIYLEDLTSTPDMDEGVAAFLEKRAANWRHR